MPILQGTGYNVGSIFYRRRVFVTDKNGVEHEIRCKEDLEAIIAQMTPQELETFKTNYRFAPIQNLTGNMNYMGTERDL